MTIKHKKKNGRVYLEEYRNVRRGTKVISTFVRSLGPAEGQKTEGYGSVLDRIKPSSSVHSGAVRLLWKLAQDLKFQETITRICNKDSMDPDPLPGILLTVWAINRVLEPKSASKLQQWVNITDLPTVTETPIDVFTKDAFLNSLDAISDDDNETGALIDQTSELNAALSKHWRSGHPLPPSMKDILAYDLTNILFFGVTCPLAKKSFNEKHENRPQVNVAVVVHKYDYTPLTHFVYKGNRNGSRTVRNLLAHMQESKIKPGMLVVDRGIMGRAIIDETTAMGWDLLGGIAKGTKPVMDILSETEVPELPTTFVKESKSGPIYATAVKGKVFQETRSLVVYTNAEKAMREREARNKDLSAIGRELSHLSEKGESWDEAELHKEIKKIVGAWRPYIKVQVKRGEAKPRIEWTYLERRLKMTGLVDGKYLLLCTDEKMGACEVVDTYFSKDFAEKLFRTLKTDVGIEPARHRLAPRVRAYIFVCMLAYRLIMALRWLLIEKGVTENTSEFMDRFLEELWEVERIEIKLGGQKKIWYLNVTEFVEEGLRKTGMRKLLTEREVVV
jgi:hypothetical protein